MKKKNLICLHFSLYLESNIMSINIIMIYLINCFPYNIDKQFCLFYDKPQWVLLYLDFTNYIIVKMFTRRDMLLKMMWVGLRFMWCQTWQCI